MQTAIHLGFSKIPRWLSRTIPPSKHGHREQKALLLTVPEHLERVAHGTQPETGGGSTPTGPVLAPLTPLAYGPQYGISR
jgi:hypothetical protein